MSTKISKINITVTNTDLHVSPWYSSPPPPPPFFFSLMLLLLLSTLCVSRTLPTLMGDYSLHIEQKAYGDDLSQAWACIHKYRALLEVCGKPGDGQVSSGDDRYHPLGGVF